MFLFNYIKDGASKIKNVIDYGKNTTEYVWNMTKEGAVISVVNNLLKNYLRYDLEIEQSTTNKDFIEFHSTEKIAWIEFDEFTLNEYVKDTPFNLLALKLKKLKAPLSKILSNDIPFSTEGVVLLLTTNKEANKRDQRKLEKEKVEMRKKSANMSNNTQDLNTSYIVNTGKNSLIFFVFKNNLIVFHNKQ